MVEVAPVNTTYEPFSHEPEYIEANRAFIERQSLTHVGRFLDLACGTGTISELLLGHAPEAHLNGVDYDPVQVQLSSERFRKLGYEVRHGFELTEEYAGGKPVLVFGEGDAGALPFAEQSFDCVTICNAIHLIENKPRLLQSIGRLLKPGGVFGFNTAFYSGSMPEGTERLYMDWLQRATSHIVQKSSQQVAAGLPPIKRQRGTTRKAFTNPWFTSDEWTQMMADAQLQTIDCNVRVVDLSEQSFTSVGAYGGMAQVLLSGFPVDIASEALQVAAVPAMRAAGVSVVPRNYLEMWARRL